MKKFIGIVLCISMVLSCLTSVFAAQTEIGSKTWLQTFTGYESGVPDEMELGNITEGLSLAVGESGLFGKAADDTAFALKIDHDESVTVTNEQTYPYFQWTRTRTTAGIENFSENDIFCWGYEFALDSYYGTKDIRLDVQNQDNQRKSFALVSMANNSSGKTMVNGQTLTSYIPLNTWVSFDFVLHTGTNLLDVYYNGNKVIENMDLTDKIGTSTSRVNFYRMFMRPQKVDGKYAKTTNYIDNFYAKVVTEEPVITPVTLTSQSSDIMISQQAKSISANAELSVSEFKNLLTAPEGCEIIVEDESKNEQTGIISAGYVRIKTADNKYAYYTLTTYTPSVLVYNGFDSLLGKTFENNQTIDGITVYSSEGDSASGVLEDGETVIKIKTAPNGKTSARKLNMQRTDVGEDCFAIAFDFKTDRCDSNAGMTIRYENASGGQQNYNDVISFKNDGSIQFSYNNVGRYEANTWYHITIFASQVTKKAALYINGEFVTEINWNILSSFNRIIEAMLHSYGPESSEKNTYYDNLCIMPITGMNSVDTSVMNINTSVSEKNITDKNVISGYGKMTVGDFKNMLTVPSGASVIAYMGKSECDDDTVLKDGMFIKVKALDNRHKAVYYFKEAMKMKSSVLVNDKAVNQLYSGAAKGRFEGYVQTPTDIYMVISEYKNGALVQTKELSKTVSKAFSEDVLLDSEVFEAPGVEIRFNVYDNKTDLNKLIDEKIVAYSDNLELSSEIMGAYGGKDAIYSITMDDGYTQSLTKYYKPWFDKYNLVGSSLSICTWMTPEFLAVAKPMVKKGQLGVMSHSYTHPGTAAAIEANLTKEIAGSQKFLQKTFPGEDVLSYGPGGGVTSNNILAKVKETYYASRTGTRGYNDFNISGDAWYDVNVQGVLGSSDNNWKSSENKYDGVSAATMNGWLDYAVENNKWLVEMWHSVCWPTAEGSTTYESDGGYRPIPADIGEEHLKYASALQSNGKIWVAKFDDAVKYLREKNSSALVDTATKTSRKITLTNDLDKTIFNHPLTIKSQMPSDWKYAKITQGDIVTYKEVLSDENGSYIIYDALANFDEIVIEKADELKESKDIEKLSISIPENLEQNILEGESFEAVNFNVTSDISNIDKNDIVWYVDASPAARGESFSYTPGGDGEKIICARYAGKYSVNLRVNSSVTVPSKSVVISNLKFRGNSVTLAENEQEFDANGTLKFMWGDMSNEKMSFQHGWFAAIKNIPEALTDAKFMTTGADFDGTGTTNYLEFDVDRSVVVVGMFEGDATKTALASDGWTICSSSLNSELYNKYHYMRGDKTSYFTYMFYKEFKKGSVSIPYSGVNAWAKGGGFAIVEKAETTSVTLATTGSAVIANGENLGPTATKDYAPGQTLSLSAQGDGAFMYWKDADSGLIVSYNKDYEFTVGSKRSLIAIFADSEKAYVTFRNINGFVLAEGAADNITVPQNPYVYGYEFAGWYTGDNIKTSLKAGDSVNVSENTLYFAGFAKKDTTYTIKVDTDEKTYLYNDKVTVNAESEKDGKAFSYWERDGKAASYNTNYSFYVTANSTLVAVYGENVNNKNVLVMANPVMADQTRIAFFAERNIDDSLTVIENGILLGKNENLSIDSANVIKAVAKNNTKNGQLTIRKKDVSSGDVWYGRAYAICADSKGNTQIIYSNEVSMTVE